MKKVIVSAFTMLICLSFFCGTGLAAYSFDITTDYSGGDQITFNINFLTDETIILNGYGLSFSYNANDLAYDSYTNVPPTGFIPNFGAPLSGKNNAPIANTPGILENFNASIFGPGISLNQDTYLGSITFNVANGAVADGTDDFGFYLDSSSNINVAFNNNLMQPINISNGIESYLNTTTFDIGNPAPVPVPSAIWLLGTGLIGLAGLRRRNA